MGHLPLNHHYYHQHFYAHLLQFILAPFFPLQVETFYLEPLRSDACLLLHALVHSTSSPRLCFHGHALFPNSYPVQSFLLLLRTYPLHYAIDVYFVLTHPYVV